MFLVALLVVLHQTCSYEASFSNITNADLSDKVDPIQSLLSRLDDEYYYDIVTSEMSDDEYDGNTVIDDYSTIGISEEYYGENSVIHNHLPNARSFVPPFTPTKSRRIVCINETHQTVLNFSRVELCGGPGICHIIVDYDSNSSCFCATVWDCTQCSRVLAIGAVMAIFFLGVLILLSNGAIIYITLSNTRSSHTYMKCSLALADLLTGIVLLASGLPTHLSAVKFTGEDILSLILSSEDSVYAKIFGSILVLSITASVYHLVLMSLERLVVIQYPFITRNQNKYKIRISLGAVWVWSAFITSIPVFFPNYFGYALNPPTLLSLIEVKVMNGSITHGIFYLVALLLFPYTLAVCLTVTTACLVRVKLRQSRFLKPNMNRTLQSSNESPAISKKRSNGIQFRRLKPEIAILKTTAIMIFGFTITLVPLFCVVALFYISYMECSNFSTTYSACFYLSLSNSFVNFIIYSWRDESFRRKLLKRICVSNKRRSSWSYYSGSAARHNRTRLSQLNSSMNDSVVKST